MVKARTEDEDILNEENQLQVPFARWQDEDEKPFLGRVYMGVLVNTEDVPNNLPGTEGTQVRHYTLVNAKMKNKEGADWEEMEGNIVKISGRTKADPSVLPTLDLCKLGQIVAVKFVEERTAKKKGMHPAKIIRVYSKGEMDMEALRKFQGNDTDEEGNEVDPEATMNQM